ncbi:hypothetical protein QOZ80_1BG0092580 [Eleusine coracana subsp. coracana]|nr:hypothetical protein QOZ80_1BG0092580 [Eleusine coracana subsp. coracana]
MWMPITPHLTAVVAEVDSSVEVTIIVGIASSTLLVVVAVVAAMRRRRNINVVLMAMMRMRERIRRAPTTRLLAGRPLSGGQSLVSKRGKFRLGFFRPDNSSARWYLGIWYNQISVQTNAWVANRATPISTSDLDSSQLSIASDGNMVLLDHRNSSIWSTNVTGRMVPGKDNTSTTVGVILDTGNLVLAEASNTSAVLWQSFDHFGDTWLPGGKLGRNKLTGEVTRLTAWKGYADPSPSLFSLELDPRGGTSQYLLNWNSSQQYWSSGNWTGHSFTAVPEMMASDASQYSFGYVDGAEESYFVYDVKDEAVVTRFLVDVTGQIKFLTWVQAAGEWVLFWAEPKAQCDVYALCGAFAVCTDNAVTPCACLRGFAERSSDEWRQGDRSSGCARNADLHCSSNSSARGSQGAGVQNKDDRFYTMPNVRLPSNAQQSVTTTSVRECELACLGNCSCTAYSYDGRSCSVWYGDLVNLQDTTSAAGTARDGSSISIRLAASEFFSTTSATWKTKLVITVLVVAAAIALLLTLLVLMMRRRRRLIIRRKRRRRVEAGGSLMAFTYRDLQSVTKGFSEKLGGGAFGSVFKGALPDDAATPVAVKKLEGLRQGEKQFRAEVSTIGTIHHVNLIRLLGFCSDRRNRLLVYEHMPNASLDRHLFGASALSWEARYQIALGVARGLDYLHEKCRDCIIHCDIKPENILLDHAFVPKVADFGLAKLMMGHDFSRVLTTMRGTFGYLAPEWIAGTPVTTKADVFSYGMMLFELVSGRRNVGYRDDDGAVDFFPATAASLLFGGGDVATAVDGRIGAGNVDVAEVERACKVACWCVQDDETARPSMGMVVQVLEGLVDVNVPPIPRSLKVLADPSKYLNFFSGGLPST